MFCLDTNIVIFATSKRQPRVAARLDAELALGTPIIMPAIVLFELRYGIAKSDLAEKSLAELTQFLAAAICVVHFNAETAADIRAHLERAGTPIGPYDLLIAAQARRRGAVLVTLNRRKFDRVPGLMVTDWGGMG